jgi:Fe-S-cluster-containing dehydrogenase component/CRP-like cAMP-binding protein
MAKPRVIRPPARLEPRPGDEQLTAAQIRKISWFKKLELGDFPGTVVLRHYRAQEIICRQNEPGYTAFYVLTDKDLRELRQEQQPALDTPVTEELVVAQATIALPRRQGKDSQATPGYIRAGEIFGEMSCLYRQPRSATVGVLRDCCVLEFHRHILDKIYADREFRQRLDDQYFKRVRELHLPKLALFRDLDPKLLDGLGKNWLELPVFEPGDLICDEHDRSESMFLIRMGFVKVVANASSLLSVRDVPRWDSLCQSLLLPAANASAARQVVWKRFPPVIQDLIRSGASGTLTPDQQQEIVWALNDLLKDARLPKDKMLEAVVKEAQLNEAAKELPAATKKWSQHQKVCQFNRRLLDFLYPGVIPPLRTSEETGRMLNYRSTGDMIGEMGLFSGQPRSATCVAYVHHGEGKAIHGRVELARINKETFDKLRQEAPAAEEEIKNLTARRRQEKEVLQSLPLWDDALPAALTATFDQLGLIQGRHLMLIDLDRCTRCDECVKACVSAHQPAWFPWPWRKPDPARDGRSRLFLDGQRISVRQGAERKNYLLPTTCRQCQDAICLVGCPVGSIHKGDSGEILIEDWCIGCSRCAQQCPYGAIQMHPIGLIPRRSHGWEFRRWPHGKRQTGATPFRHDRTFQELCPGDGDLEFRREFNLPAKVCRESQSYRLEAWTLSENVHITINGQKVFQGPAPKTEIGQREDRYTIECLLGLEGERPPRGEKAEVEPERLFVLRQGQNKIVVRLLPTTRETDPLLDLGLFAHTKPVVDASLVDEDCNQELVVNRAIVCDLCDGDPACVHACPHDAALRVESRSFFGLG